MVANYLIPLVVLVWLLYRQVQKRPIGGNGSAGRRGGRRQVALILFAVGAIQLVEFAQRHPLNAATVAILAVSFAVGAGLGVARAFTVRLWTESGRLYRQGTALTVALWLVATGMHLASEKAILHEGGPRGAGSASLVLYFALALTVQTHVLRRRARAYVDTLRGRSLDAAAAI